MPARTMERPARLPFPSISSPARAIALLVFGFGRSWANCTNWLNWALISSDMVGFLV